MLDIVIKMLRKAEREYPSNMRKIGKKITQNAALSSKSRSWRNIENNLKDKKKSYFDKQKDL